MRILVVAPWVPNSRRPRSLGLIRHLSRNHELSIVAVAWSAEEAGEASELPADRLHIVRLHPLGGAARSALALGGKASLQQAYLDSRKLRAVLREEVRLFKPDLAYFNVVRSLHLMNEVHDIPTLIDLDERRSDYYRQVADSSRNPIWRIIGRIEYARMRRAEDEALSRAQSLMVSSPLDLNWDDKLTLVRSPHALGDTGDRGASPQDGRIVFVGRLGYQANVEAVSRFVHRVLPLVRARMPHVHLQIVGDGGGREINALRRPGVEIVGRVESVLPYYLGAAVSVVPVELATGVQMKLIESLAIGVPTICTPRVASQAGVEDGDECLVAESDEEWATAIERALTDHALRARLSGRGKLWAAREYSPATIEAALDQAVSRALAPAATHQGSDAVS